VTYGGLDLVQRLLKNRARDCEGIWGSAQRSRWKFWARIEGPKDERQGEPALAFSICGREQCDKGMEKVMGKIEACDRSIVASKLSLS
jgi:hypothetical protein